MTTTALSMASSLYDRKLRQMDVNLNRNFYWVFDQILDQDVHPGYPPGYGPGCGPSVVTEFGPGMQMFIPTISFGFGTEYGPGCVPG